VNQACWGGQSEYFSTGDYVLMGVRLGEAVLCGEDQGERAWIERICGWRQFLGSKEVFLSNHYDLQSTDTSSTGGGVVLEK
jgi:hypothetical protein